MACQQDVEGGLGGFFAIVPVQDVCFILPTISLSLTKNKI